MTTGVPGFGKLPSPPQKFTCYFGAAPAGDDHSNDDDADTDTDEA